MKLKILFIFTACLFLIECKTSNKKNEQQTETEIYYKPKFSERFIIKKEGSDKFLTVINPWQGSQNTKFVYKLTKEESKDPRTIKIPVKRVVCLSSTHVAFMDFIDETDKIVGVSGVGYISSPKAQKLIDEKKILDVGYENYLSYEVIASLKPDLVFAYGVDGELGSVEAKLNEMGIKLVYIGEYLEKQPIAKTEWAVAFAAFFEKENEAAEKVDSVEKKYESLKKMAATELKKPKILINAPYKDVWYIPSRESAMVNMLKDAGGEYIFEDEANTESKPVGIEYAYKKGLEADIWINLNSERHLNDILKSEPRLKNIKAFKNKEVFNNTKRTTAGGGSDFWESGVVNPHIILEDLIKIFHPELLPKHELYYYEKLN